MTSDIPHIRLAGRDYPVPPLVPSQQRIVVPALSRLGHLAREKMTTEHYDDLLRIVYFGAMKKADPALRFEDLLEMPIAGEDLLAAVRVIQDQTGLFKQAAIAAPEADRVGE